MGGENSVNQRRERGDDFSRVQKLPCHGETLFNPKNRPNYATLGVFFGGSLGHVASVEEGFFIGMLLDVFSFIPPK